MGLDLIKETEDGQNYQAEGFKLLYRKAGSVAGDNNINVKERIYLVSGEAKVTVLSETTSYSAPDFFTIPAKTYHKLEAITDVVLVIFEN